MKICSYIYLMFDVGGLSIKEGVSLLYSHMKFSSINRDDNVTSNENA